MSAINGWGWPWAPGCGKSGLQPQDDDAAVLELNAIAAARRNAASLWYVPQSLAGVYQDSAGTTPAALNAPIGLVTDMSGLGRNATQATTANKPTVVRLANGRYAMQFDGSNDFLTGPAPASRPTAETFIFAGSWTVNGANIGYFLSRRGADGWAYLRKSAADDAEVGWANGSVVNATVFDPLTDAGAATVVTGLAKSGAVSLRVNGQVRITNTSAVVLASSATPVGLGSISGLSSSAPLPGSMSLACWLPGEMPDADRIAIERFAAYLSGAPYAL